jgi:hypothetical protein
MKSSLLTTTAGLNLLPLTWNAFAQVATGTFTNLTASIVPTNLIVAAQNGIVNNPNLSYTFPVPVPMPAWIQPGVTVKVAMSVASGNGVSLDISGYYVVKAFNASSAANHNTFTVDAPSSQGGRDAVAITKAGSYNNDSSVGGIVTNPLISLIAECQKAVFKATTGTVTLTPSVDSTGAAPYPTTLVAGQIPEQEYEIDTQPGSKLDLGDWSVMTCSAGTLAVRFI